jgi:uncharacterized protein YndB with AHSA1/START domain
MSNIYHVVTHWRVKARAEEVFDIINQPIEYSRWWPSVYLDSREIAGGEEDGIGRRMRFHTKGWLPYTLHWESCTTEVVPPNRIVIEAAGDFAGRGVWSFAQDGEFVDIDFDWTVTASKPMLDKLSPVMHPVFEANHRWAMEQGLICLREELIRYRALTPADLLRAAEPRGPVEVPVRWIAAGAVAISALACLAFAKRRSRPAGA